MGQVLFVHAHQDFLNRIREESKGDALLTTSLIDALKWIADPSIKITALYINPDDSSFSSFQFIDLALNHRPSVPIFLIESYMSKNSNAFNRLKSNIHVRGIFSGTEPYSTFLLPLRGQIKAEELMLASTQQIKPIVQGHVTMPASDFYTGTHYPFDLFVFEDASQQTIRLFAQRDTEIDPVLLSQLIARTPWVLVRNDDIQKTKDSLEQTQREFPKQKDASMPWKAAELMVSTKGLLKNLKEAGVSDSLLSHTQLMLSDLFSLISDVNTEEQTGSLFDLIEKAKSCDRAAFCATYSMMMCKQLRFEKTATLEILGFASILQDIALYKTRFGDLSEKLPFQMSDEEKTVYHHHPVDSADLMSTLRDIPQVTLQVVRQQHERRDKSGFPNRLGGQAVHPMAEVLSIINYYFDIMKTSTLQSEIVQRLTREAFPHYSDHIVNAFKQVLGQVLKDKILVAHTEQKK